MLSTGTEPATKVQCGSLDGFAKYENWRESIIIQIIQ